MKRHFWIVLVLISMFSCKTEPSFTPKPHSYPKIIFPERGTKSFVQDDCPMRFDYPDYAHIERDKSFFDEEVVSDCWFDVVMPDFNGRLHCSYFAVKSRTNFDEYVNDAFEMVSKHRIKANYRDEYVVNRDDGTGGIIYELDGPVASKMQFFLTDTTQHFIRGSLYFNNQVAPDSMAPIYNFVKEDMLALIESFEWKN